MTLAERNRRRKQATAAAVAQREAQRRAGRESERRRMLGNAPATAQRYAEAPEPFKRQAAAYYAEHAEQVKAKRRARYAAKQAPSLRRSLGTATARKAAALVVSWPGVNAFPAKDGYDPGSQKPGEPHLRPALPC